MCTGIYGPPINARVPNYACPTMEWGKIIDYEIDEIGSGESTLLIWQAQG